MGCGALCQLHESCEAFLLRDTGLQRRQVCTILKELSHTTTVTDDYEERAYVTEDKGKEFKYSLCFITFSGRDHSFRCFVMHWPVRPKR